ncbi:MAG: class I tRNA ligase family protein [Oscillospiraceae bacterium]|jgi:methionyl-tRNA synthetase|nr:class I tRNA ligase family protein [Oscillospiraceae bacterium]
MRERPDFPKRAVITGGMPYGNKNLHFGHIGGVFVFADTFARFLRDRIGEENVIFVSGTDCYGSPIVESYRKLCEETGFTGTIEDFVESNHKKQKEVLDSYYVKPNLFAASGLGKTHEVHEEFTNRFMRKLYNNGHLKMVSTAQFFDEEAGVFLNGRQVVGKCPVNGCGSEKGYADECDLGHQYMPSSLINPKSTLTGTTPTMKNVSNWYFTLTEKLALLREYAELLKSKDNTRDVVIKTISEFLEPPVIYVMNDYFEDYKSLDLPNHKLIQPEKKTSFTLEFETLSDCDKAVENLSKKGIRFRTGKTLVPFRLTGNVEWSLKAPKLENEDDLTVWVWPESLWAPISFTIAYLESIGKNNWKDFWCSKDSEIFQFIGQDNIYFYGVAQPAMFLALQEGENINISPKDGEMQNSTLVANHHILFLNKKASSSGNVKPPMADELLNYYTPEQLRMHFLALGLGQRSVSFMPKPLNPTAKETDSDPVLNEGSILTHVFNRIIRTAFYDTQKHLEGIMPIGKISEDIKTLADTAVTDYEYFMYHFEFHRVISTVDTFIRKSSKYMAKAKSEADKSGDINLIKQWLTDIFYVIKTACLLLHPIAPDGVEKVREYLCEDNNLYNWDNAFTPFTTEKQLKFLEPRVDFFVRHESQLKG